jgi:hypothetical protein
VALFGVLDAHTEFVLFQDAQLLQLRGDNLQGIQ